MIYDKEGILEELETQLSSKSQWRKTFFQGVYRRINEVIAYVLDKFVYLTEFYYKESSWDEATQKESLLARTEYYHYNPYRKVGAVGNIALIGDPTWEIDLEEDTYYSFVGPTVIIPQWTQFTDDDEEVFVYSTEQTIYYENTESYIDIPVKEGIPKQYTYIATGTSSETFELTIDNIDNTEVYVYIVDEDNTILNTVIRCEQDVEDKLFFIEDLDNYYCSIKNSLQMDSIVITFGDGIKSKKLALNERVLIKFATTQGADGNITNVDTITTIYTPLNDTEGDEAVLYVRNLESISNGSDKETIDSIRYNAPNLYNSGYRCGGYDDWVTILEADSRIYKAKIWSTDDVADDTITTNQNKVFVVAIGNDGEELSETTQDDITINTLKSIKSPTELVSWETLNKIYAIFQGDADVSGITSVGALSQINTALNTKYDILNVDFKESIYQSNFNSVIDNLSVVNFHNTEIYHGEKFDETAYIFNHIILPSATGSDTAVLEDQVWLSVGSIEVWACLDISSGDTKSPLRVAYESSGTIIGDNDYTVSYPNIDRATNSITFQIDELVDLADYEIMLEYQTKDGNGNFTNDLRLLQSDFITDVDIYYNQFDITVTG